MSTAKAAFPAYNAADAAADAAREAAAHADYASIEKTLAVASDALAVAQTVLNAARARAGACKQLEKELAAALEELNAYRHGGLTEEILRRNDGYIKVGAGVSFVLTSDINPKLT